MAATPISSFRLNLKLKARLMRIAKEEQRDLTYIIDKVMSDYADAYERKKGWGTK